MSTDGVNASPADVKKLAAVLTKYQNTVKSASKEVQAALHSASWNDRQKDRFEARYRDVQKTVDRFMSTEVQSMVKSLHELARRLEEIRGMRM